MNREPPRSLTASVRQRLLNVAREQRQDFQRLLRRYAQERLLYRLSRSRHRDSFTLPATELPTLPQVIEALHSFLMPLLRSVGEGSVFLGTWPPGGPWVGSAFPCNR